MRKKKEESKDQVLNDVLDSLINDRETERTKKTRKISEGPVTFHIRLTKEQKLAKAAVLTNVVTFLKGKPGTSKSTIACHAALDRLLKGHVDRIILTRPTVEVGKTQGYLPGDAFSVKEGKSGPYVAPLIDVMNKLRDPNEIQQLVEKEKIVVLPIQFVRGRNFENVFVIVDESQNLNVEEMKALTTRICDNSWMCFTSDINQIDLHYKDNSAAHFVDAIAGLEGVAVVELFENFRHPLAIQIMDLLDEQVQLKKKKKDEIYSIRLASEGGEKVIPESTSEDPIV